MDSTPKQKRSFINKIRIKDFSIPITFGTLTIAETIYFNISNTNQNSVNIGSTGTSSYLEIHQNNDISIQTITTIILCIAFLFSLIYSILKIARKSDKEN